MDAATLNCPSCGAAAPANATACPFCHAKLATIGCPSCFGLVFIGAKFCDHCGAKIEVASPVGTVVHKCPRGCGEMQRVSLGGAEFDECPQCNGLWLDPATFEHLCAEKEQVAPAIFQANAHLVSAAPQALETVRYLPCPQCGKLMNRTNFGRTSGVIIDTCKDHGVWFDADELRRVIEFLRAGGLEISRKRELEQLTEERKLRELTQFVSADQEAIERHVSSSDIRPGAALLSAFISLKL